MLYSKKGMFCFQRKKWRLTRRGHNVVAQQEDESALDMQTPKITQTTTKYKQTIHEQKCT